MECIVQDSELYLLVDIDDVLVFSSDKLQERLDQKTNFKTSVLKMLEQLNRNCKYFLSQVKLECSQAKTRKERPNLYQFLVFDNMRFNNQFEYYTKPVEAAGYYLEVANALLNEFLEERDTFLEIDNLPYGEIKKFNYKKEMQTILTFADLINNNMDAFHKINTYCLDKANELINFAKTISENDSLVIPEYGALVSMDTNDIIKTGSLTDINSIGYKKYILYQKPLEDLENCINLENRIYDIVTNAEVFINPSTEIIDYESIHNEKNVNWSAVQFINKIIELKIFKGVYFSTHHNGGREEKAKISLMQRILPKADGFIGQRFHADEHNAMRRGRSSKVDEAVEILDVKPEQLVLLDDSTANCGDCKSKLGTEILLKAETDSEKIKGEFENIGYNRILDFDDNRVYGYIAEAALKQKIKRK